MERAREWGFARLTVPPLGIGAGNLSVEDAADILLSELKDLPPAAVPADVAIVGDEATVAGKIKEVLDKGATDFVVAPFDNRERTLDAVAPLL